jgi:hypothetical protein
VIDYGYHEYVTSAKNYEGRRDITIMKQQSTKVVISDGGFQQNRGLRTTVGVSNKWHCKREAIERHAEWFAIQ